MRPDSSFHDEPTRPSTLPARMARGDEPTRPTVIPQLIARSHEGRLRADADAEADGEGFGPSAPRLALGIAF
jgi:hypothetical protein